MSYKENEKIESKTKTYNFPSRDTPNGSGDATFSSLYIGLAIKCLCEILVDIHGNNMLLNFERIISSITNA